jgi:large conductance mechanosensitive channel
MPLRRIAAAFTSVVSSFVSDILLPPISLIPFIDRNLDEKFAVLRSGAHRSGSYNTSKQALDDGAVVMAYGFVLGM